MRALLGPGRRVIHPQYGAGTLGVSSGCDDDSVVVLFDQAPDGDFFGPRLFRVDPASLTIAECESLVYS